MKWLTENWLVVVIVVGAVALLLRRAGMGCGTAGHATHVRSHREEDPSSIDIVSGEKVAPDSALVARHGARLYRFASRETLERFESDPERYIRGGAGRHGPGTSHRHGGHGGCC